MSSRSEMVRDAARRGSRTAAEGLLRLLESEAVSELQSTVAPVLADPPEDAAGWLELFEWALRCPMDEQGNFLALFRWGVWRGFVVAGERLAFVSRVREFVRSGRDPFPALVAEVASVPLSALRAARASRDGAAVARLRAKSGGKPLGRPRGALPAELVESLREAARSRYERAPRTYSVNGLAASLRVDLAARGVEVSESSLRRVLPSRKELDALRASLSPDLHEG